MQPKGGYTLLYFVKSKNNTKCKNFVDLLCSYVNTFINSFVLSEISGRGATAPLASPKSATAIYQQVCHFSIFTQVFIDLCAKC